MVSNPVVKNAPDSSSPFVDFNLRIRWRLHEDFGGEIFLQEGYRDDDRWLQRGARHRKSALKIPRAVKRVVDHNVKVRVKSDDTGVDIASVKVSMNTFDEIAADEAVRLKEAGVATEVAAVPAGGLHVRLSQNGEEVAAFKADGPRCFTNGPGRTYQVAATHNGVHRRTTLARGERDVHLR
jgi:hypothetical protein